MTGKDLNQNSNGKGCWYKIYYFECPVCGKGDEIRERQYTPRPEKWEDRHVFVTSYDYCDVW